jgi:hypothetical protein
MAFSHVATLAIAGGTVGSNLTAFPLYVDLEDMPASLWTGAKEDGGDIRVYASDGTTQLAFDLFIYEPHNEKGAMFVRTDISTSGTTIVIKWGDAALSRLAINATYGRNAVWADYDAVSLCGEDPRDRTGKTTALVNGDPSSLKKLAGPTAFTQDPHQGGTYDPVGQFTYLIDTNAIYKFDATMTLVATNSDPVGDSGISPANHLSDGFYHDGKLYIPIDEYASNVGVNDHIGVFDADDLSFIEAYDISATMSATSGVCYCPIDGLIYATDWNDGLTLYKFTLAGVPSGTLTLSGAGTLARPQGIEWWHGAFWISSDDTDEVVRCEYNGSYTWTGLFGAAVTGNFEGIWAKEDRLVVLSDPSSANSFIEEWGNYHNPLSAGGGWLNTIGTTNHLAMNDVASRTVWTIGITGKLTATGANRGLVSYFDHVGGTGTNDRAGINYRHANLSMAAWDDTNGWLQPSPAFAPGTDFHRYHLQYNGSTGREMFADGVSIATQGAITSRTGFTALWAGIEDADFVDPWGGEIGFVYLRNGLLAVDWIEAEYANLNSPSTFYTITEDDAISGIDPTFGSSSGGTAVTLTGVGFTGATGVLFDTDAATSFVVVNDNTITCETPAHAIGTVDVTVERPTTDLVLAGSFTFTDVPAPSVTTITPAVGTVAGGTAVTVVGDHFTDVTDVEIDGLPVTSLVIVDDETITFVTPAHAQGAVDVVLFSPNGNTTVTDGFDYVVVARLTQVPLLMVNLPYQPSRVTQVPLLVVNLPIQGALVTQIAELMVWTPTPIPLPTPVVPEVPVKETWQYSTVVNIAERGKEQRSCLRAAPRVNMTFNALIMDESERRDVYQMLFKFISRVFNYPLYSHGTKLDAAALAGDTKLYFDPATTDMRAGEAIALIDPVTMRTTLGTIVTVDSDGATTEALPVDVPRHWYVAPAPVFRASTNVGFNMGAIGGDFTLSMLGAQSRAVLRPGQSSGLLTTIDGMLLLDKRPLADDDVDEGFDQNVEWLDNGIAPPEPRTNWETPFISGERSFLVHRPSGMDYWRAVADNLRGRWKPFLMPTFRNDLPLYETPALSATEIKTSNVQFFDFWRSKAWRYIRIQSSAGVIYRKINEVVDSYDADGTPLYMTLKLSASIGAGAGANENMMISFCNTCRLDSDEFVMQHGPVDTIMTLKVRVVEE